MRHAQMSVSESLHTKYESTDLVDQTAASNKKQIRDIYRRIDALATSLKCGTQDGDMLSPEHQKAIIALARCVHLRCIFCDELTPASLSDVKILEEDLGDILQERKSRFRRFFSAKRHRSELQDVVNQLESAKTNYMVRISIARHARVASAHCVPR